MKTAVSIPDDVFADAEWLARRLKKSRSRLYSEALAEYVARHSADDVTEDLDRALASIGDAESSFLTRAGRRTLRRARPSRASR